MRTASLSLALLLAAALAAAQAPSTSKGTMSIDLSLTDDNGIDAVTEIITLKNIRASEIEPFIRARLSRYGAVQVNDALNMLLVTDKQPKLRDLAGIVRTLDAAGVSDFLRLETEAVRLQYVQPSVVRPYLAKRLSSEGTIEANDTLNLLIITDLRSRIEAIKRLLPQFDIMPRQVAVEFKVFDVTKLAASKTGFDWFEILGHADAMYGYRVFSSDDRSTNINQTNYQQPPPVQHWENQGRGVNRTFTATLNNRELMQYLEQSAIGDRVALVANPVVLVQNRTPGTISSSINLPYAASANYGQMSNDYVFVTVLPKMTETDMVGIKTTLRLQSSAQSSTNNTLENEVTVAAGQPIVIGKLTQKVSRTNRKGIPGLKDIPVLGYLFGRNVTAVEDHQLLVFAIPHVLQPGQGIADTTQFRGSE
ncbi:hypothetical protein EG831_01460 [bacterium]|nr:hypothetical protein [bacterium]